MEANTAHADGEAVEVLTVDELAARVGLPVRTIREYQTMGLLPPPARRGRVGIYGPGHVARLELIGRLQARGYSLAGIRDLLHAWREGADLSEVLGLRADELVHVEEPGAPVTAGQLARALPGLIPEHRDELLATGVVEVGSGDTYCVPSPSLLQLGADALHLGYAPEAVLGLLRALRRAADTVADAALEAIGEFPPQADAGELLAFATRARGLLAHGTGRLAIHTLGARLGITDEEQVTDGLRRLLEGSHP